jgi:hypothetical protein
MRTADTRLPPCLPQISDMGLSYLADMPSLCVADVRGCFRVTVGGAAALRHRTGTLGTVVSQACAIHASGKWHRWRFQLSVSS